MSTKSKKLSSILIPVSLGELIDKITILEIKKERMTKERLRNVENELKSLEKVIHNNYLEIDITLSACLKEVNISLWEIEDKIREKESKGEFDNEFIQLARSVYKQNDRRVAIKREINNNCNSDIIEEKLYKKYD